MPVEIFGLGMRLAATLASDTTLRIYAFGYDSDRSAGSYTLGDLTVSATQIHPGS